MNIIDLVNEAGYIVHRFPDGEVAIELTEVNRREPLHIKCRIRNAEELFLLMQLSDIVNRQGLLVDTMNIYYLMSARNDRLFSEGRALNLKIIANVINSFNSQIVNILDPHNEFASLSWIKNSVSYRPDMKMNGITCFPDKGAALKYKDVDKSSVLTARKVRSNTGIQIELLNPEDISFNHIVTVFDDLIDGGGTFIALAPVLRAEIGKKYKGISILRLNVVHAIQEKGLIEVAKLYDEVTITNSYRDWDKWEELPENVKVINVIK